MLSLLKSVGLANDWAKVRLDCLDYCAHNRRQHDTSPCVNQALTREDGLNLRAHGLAPSQLNRDVFNESAPTACAACSRAGSSSTQQTNFIAGAQVKRSVQRACSGFWSCLEALREPAQLNYGMQDVRNYATTPGVSAPQ